ncbi:MAG TPA: metallophosphoesterase family protein [Candidatus Manganitrophaceae bacterium]|nr:metallophosphoesterase family protein [Candidatus Manganitrophaceae bacterium]
MDRIYSKVREQSWQRSFFPLLVILSAALSACGGGSAPVSGQGAGAEVASQTAGGAPTQAISVTVEPAEAAVTTKGSQTFYAKVEGGTDGAVFWSIQEGPAGGAINNDGTYTAPAAPGTYHVTAASQADPTKTASVTVNVTAAPVVSVAITPGSLGLMTRGKKSFTAAVSGTDQKGVTWQIQEGIAGGTIDPEGEYVAPNTIGVYHVIATSQADPGKKAVATVEVQRCNPPQRNPYLVRMTKTSAVIGWRCRPEGAIRWGTGSSLDNQQSDDTGDDRHFVTLNGLSPDTSYTYEVVIEGEPLGKAATFTTAPASGSDFTFVALADTGSGDIHQGRIAQVIKGLPARFAILAGDIIYEKGADAEFDPRYFKPYDGIIDHFPFFPVPGNHDMVTDQGGPFRDNFYFPQGVFYRDFFWGDVHFIGLDSNHVDDAKQKEWLINALKAPARWKVVYFHHPAFSSGEYGGYPSVQKNWIPLFEQYGVDLVINGHAHDYERTVPINGVTYIVTGGGGQSLYPVGKSDFTAFSLSVHHLVSIRLTQDQMELKAIDETGATVDAITHTKGDATVPAGPPSGRG